MPALFFSRNFEDYVTSLDWKLQEKAGLNADIYGIILIYGYFKVANCKNKWP